MIRYRDATAADLPAIDALFRRSFVATFGTLYAPADLATFLAGFSAAAWADEFAQPGVAIRLAEEEGVLLGYAKIGDQKLPVEPIGAAVELRHLYLDVAAQGRGIADALLHWTIETSRARGAGELFLSVFVDNTRAKRFYARRGFEAIGRYEFPVGDHVDQDDLMRLVL
ncbi:GNAT family N-acetyltransferase [Sphingomonas rubra]|uniref:L-amino acid N-acyltransferase YncA n=1 Tax=Sphingomonas rubra TaxID=634430 RepID=A0A1I5SD10_9SPHN|nr:GNAT family N-acetyltransferase [Sphingomonas rubra]SFP68668.1 L-amino acid N-acyltransferase YncA [Sphingomonas rubra]